MKKVLSVQIQIFHGNGKKKLFILSVPENVVNKALYTRIKKTVKSWPGSGLLVKKYKEAGGKYTGKKPSDKSGLQRCMFIPKNKNVEDLKEHTQ